MDPMLGRLENRLRGLSVKYNPQKGRLELHLRGHVAQIFELGSHPEDACRQAFSAYFTAFADLCREESQLPELACA